MAKKLGIGFGAFLILAFFAGCATTQGIPDGTVDPELVGKWTTSDGSGLVFEFKDNGTMLMGTASAKQIYQYKAAAGEGKYWQDLNVPGAINLGSKGGADLKYEIDGKLLTLYLGSNLMYELKRIQ